VTALEIPYPPDFLEFEEVKFYISTGVTIGTLSYPAGFSFEADLKIFGAELRAAVAVTVSSVVVTGSIPQLNVGPLEIKGLEGRDVTLDLELGIATQNLTVDGMFEFLGAEVALFLDLEILPKPTFKFDFVLHFTELLTFEVDATMLGATNLKNFDALDFQLHALFEQHLLEYVSEQLVMLLEIAKKKTKEEIQEANSAVTAAENKYLSDINTAQADSDEKCASWVSYQQSVHDASGAVIKKYMADLKVLQDKVDTEHRNFDQALQKAENGVQHANSDRAEKMRVAEASISKAKTDWDSNVSQKERELDNAKATMSRKFGSAERDIQNAKAKVDNIQNNIDNVQNKINDYNNAHWYQLWYVCKAPSGRESCLIFEQEEGSPPPGFMSALAP
jgi:hypothetical protein